jgi:chromosome segregation ATPase
MHKKIEGMRVEVSSMRKESTTLRHELKAANHHRDVLKESIEQLEKQLKATADALAEAKLSSYSRAHRSEGDVVSAEEIESLRRQNTRYKVRAVALDEVVTTYRRGLLALSVEEGHKKNWLTHEVGVLKKGYEDEIGLLESEVSELTSRVTQGETYTRELKRQYEDDLKTLYK